MPLKQFLFQFLIVVPGFLTAQPAVSIIPKPVSLQISAGNFTIKRTTNIQFNKADKELAKAASFFSNHIQFISGYQLPMNQGSTGIELKKINNTEIGNEGYLLSVTPAGIQLSANSKEGIVHGMQSLFQLMPGVRTNAPLSIPCLEIKDFPRFKWRGMHLDVSRHFFSPELVKEYIDLMASYKMNVFHWHLVDDQGWRIEIKKYPMLTQVGAWRVDHTNLVWGTRPQAQAGEPATYGGYYTQEQLKELVQYAADRGVTIVPEIEMPGHVASAIAAYPQLSCSQLAQLPLTGGNYTNISSNYCPGNDEVFHFLEDVLTEVMAIFPSSYIHIGGDEVDKTSWKKCNRCQQRIQNEHLKNEEELQSYFIKRIEKFVQSKKRKIIGWDEILEGGLAPDATVMSWRGEKGGIDAATMDHQVVMTPGKPCYFDHYQAGPDGEPLAIGGMNTLKTVYDYEPIPKELAAEKSKFVLGAQANLWTEFITTAEQVEYMVLPRMLALAEVVWSPAASKDWIDFNQRLKSQFRLFDQKGYHYSQGSQKVILKPVVDNGKISVALNTEGIGCSIHYTTDGNEPKATSTLYQSPIVIDRTCKIRAISVCDGKVSGGVPAELSFAIHKASGKNVNYEALPYSSYMASGINALTDGIRGDFTVGRYWHGFYGKDLTATVDLGNVTSITKLSLGCLQVYNDWIFMPQWVQFETSIDGVHFTVAGKEVNSIDPSNKEKAIHYFSVVPAEQSARYIRVTAKIIDACPKGHNGEGQPGWLFADELLVE